MKKLFCLFFLVSSLGKLHATSIDLNAICQNKGQEAAEFSYTLKPDNSFASYFWQAKKSTYTRQATLLSSEGYFLLPKHILEDTEKHMICWKDVDGSEYDLEVVLVSEHPTENVAILKTDHPFGGQFPKPQLSFNRVKINEWVMVVINELSENKCFFQVGKVTDILKRTGSGPEGFYGFIGLQFRLGQSGCPVYNSQGEMVGFIDGCSNDKCMRFKPFSSIQEWIKDVIGAL